MPIRIRLSKLALFAACLLPFAWLLADTLYDRLGADPVQQITHRSGDWTLRLLLATLAVTPLRRLTGYQPLIGYRRMLGLFAFFYACLHFVTYLVLDLGGFWSELGADIIKRPSITVGFLAWLSMLPLALTSTRAMVRRLGRRWQTLHRLVYATGILAVLHYFWLVKADHREPLLYAAILTVLLAARWRGRRRLSTVA
ncbi:MAG: sulfite oxidase heme-binding subunit YedZ [Lysobacterales bacterium]